MIGQVAATVHALRAALLSGAAATGFTILAYTGQTTDGFVHTNFSGPLGLLGIPAADSQSDVVAIGDGTGDAAELSSLLQSTAPTANPLDPQQLLYQAGGTPNSSQVNVLPPQVPGAPAASAPISEQSLNSHSKPVIDANGQVDCTGAVSCDFDPNTQVTKVVYPDGVVALVQRVNDMTMVAFQTLNSTLQQQLATLNLPPLPSFTPAPMAAAPPAPPALPAPAATLAPVPDPAEVTRVRVPAAGVDPTSESAGAVGSATDNPAATSTSATPPALSPSGIRPGPRVNVSRPPVDLSPTGPNRPNSPKPGSDFVSGTIDAVTDAVGSVVEKVREAVDGINRGANQIKAPAPKPTQSDPDRSGGRHGRDRSALNGSAETP